MKKPAIPPTSTLPIELARVVEPLKQNVEIITGVRPGLDSIDQLPANATLAQVITQLNKLLYRIG